MSMHFVWTKVQGIAYEGCDRTKREAAVDNYTGSRQTGHGGIPSVERERQARARRVKPDASS
jgi:hypothetical protein